jgi:hypothetical protein
MSAGDEKAPSEGGVQCKETRLRRSGVAVESDDLRATPRSRGCEDVLVAVDLVCADTNAPAKGNREGEETRER